MSTREQNREKVAHRVFSRVLEQTKETEKTAYQVSCEGIEQKREKPHMLRL